MKTHSNDPAVPHSVFFQNSLPVAWTALSSASASAEPWASGSENEELLSALLLLEEPAVEPDDDVSVEHWLRLDAKMNLILSLLSELVVQRNGLPPAMPVSVSLSRLRIEPVSPASLPEDGAVLLVELYLSPQIPRSLKLTGRVSLEASGKAFSVQLDTLSETAQDLFERYVFRQHRRAIAHAKAVE